MPDDLGAGPPGRGQHVGGLVVDIGVQQHCRRDTKGTKHFEDPEGADPVAVVPPRGVHQIGGGHAGQHVLGVAVAEPVGLDADAHHDRQPRAVRPAARGAGRQRCVGVAGGIRHGATQRLNADIGCGGAAHDVLIGGKQLVGIGAGGAERGRLGGEHLPRLVEQRRLVDGGDVAVFGDHPPRHHGQHHVAAVLAVHQLLPQVVERGEGDGVQVDHGQVGEHARGDHPEVVAPRWRGHRRARARSKSLRAWAIRCCRARRCCGSGRRSWRRSRR